LLSAHVSERVPAAPAVYVIVLVVPLVTPAGPPALVIVPPAIVQVYVMPLRAVTCAVLERPDVIGLAAVMVGVTGGVVD
jgi:hypothetical protein